MLQDVVRPAGPYSLALSARLSSDATRTFRDGVFTTAAGAHAWQRPDGRVVVRAPDERARDSLLWQLALDADHSEFVRRFRDDAMIGRAVRELRGLRPIRTGSVAQALLRALCGQLIQASRARQLERQIVRALAPARGALHEPPTSTQLARRSPAELRALGLHARRAATLVRICGALDLERLRALPTDAVAARLERERGLGPWSVGVVCLEGLGRSERGLVGDLGLVKYLAAGRGRRVETWETAELLEPYGEWAGLASVYLLAGLGRGLVPQRPQLAA